MQGNVVTYKTIYLLIGIKSDGGGTLLKTQRPNLRVPHPCLEIDARLLTLQQHWYNSYLFHNQVEVDNVLWKLPHCELFVDSRVMKLRWPFLIYLIGFGCAQACFYFSTLFYKLAVEHPCLNLGTLLSVTPSVTPSITASTKFIHHDCVQEHLNTIAAYHIVWDLNSTQNNVGNTSQHNHWIQNISTVKDFFRKRSVTPFIQCH